MTLLDTEQLYLLCVHKCTKPWLTKPDSTIFGINSWLTYWVGRIYRSKEVYQIIKEDIWPDSTTLHYVKDLSPPKRKKNLSALIFDYIATNFF